MKKKKGISLVVLVITIIVMIVLAGAIILTLNNSGIINKATDAVEQTDLATVKELAQMAWAEAYIATDKSQEKLEDYVLKKLGEEITKAYVIEVTTSGVTVELKGPWTQQGQIVTNGKVNLTLGDSVDYDETRGETITGLQETEWAVLGASDKGELVLVSTTGISEVDLEGLAGYNRALNDLQEASNPYGDGEDVTSVRCLKLEDIQKLDESSKIYRILTTISGEVPFYWLASLYTGEDENDLYGIYIMTNSGIDKFTLHPVAGGSATVRAVVSLLPEGNITGSSASGWNIN